MTGTLRGTGEGGFVEIVEQWDTFLADAGNRLAGTFSVDSQYRNGFGPQHQKRDFNVAEVVRQ
jgi:hypothetical protein